MSERKFKPGDRVRRPPGYPSGPKFSNGDPVVTVDHYDGKRVWLVETETNTYEDYLELADGEPPVANKKITDYVETLQLAIEQVQNPELREDASNALTALLQTWVEPTPTPEYTPWRDPMADYLEREYRRLQSYIKDDCYDGFDPATPQHPFWRNRGETKMDKKTKEFVEVYAQGRARNKPLKHRP